MKWIKCSDRMPEEDIEVLFTDCEDIECGWIEDGKGLIYSYGCNDRECGYIDDTCGHPFKMEISHWMPLPELPND